MGAVVGVVLLVPAALAFAVDRVEQRRQVALLSSSAVALEPKVSFPLGQASGSSVCQRSIIFFRSFTALLSYAFSHYPCLSGFQALP